VQNCRRSRRHWSIALGAGLALAMSDACAVFIVAAPWVRPAARAQSTEAFMELRSTEGATLVDVRSDAAATISILPPGKHRATITRLPLPADAAVRLAPGSYRLGLRDLARSVKPGDRVFFTLTIEGADGTRQEIPIDAEVRRHSPIDDELHAHHH